MRRTGERPARTPSQNASTADPDRGDEPEAGDPDLAPVVSHRRLRWRAGLVVDSATASAMALNVASVRPAMGRTKQPLHERSVPEQPRGGSAWSIVMREPPGRRPRSATSRPSRRSRHRGGRTGAVARQARTTPGSARRPGCPGRATPTRADGPRTQPRSTRPPCARRGARGCSAAGARASAAGRGRAGTRGPAGAATSIDERALHRAPSGAAGATVTGAAARRGTADRARAKPARGRPSPGSSSHGPRRAAPDGVRRTRRAPGARGTPSRAALTTSFAAKRRRISPS